MKKPQVNPHTQFADWAESAANKVNTQKVASDLENAQLKSEIEVLKRENRALLILAKLYLDNREDDINGK